MPELPEVETIARGLEPELTGRTIVSVEVRWPGVTVVPPGPGKSRARTRAAAGTAFRATVEGKAVRGVRRRGKLLLVELSGNGSEDISLAVHLKMTGRLWLPPAEQYAAADADKADPHLHLVFHLDDGRELHFHDTRKFGYVLALNPAGLAGLELYASMGPEPLEIAPKAFAKLFSGRNRRMKDLLLDQKVIAGVGNIYADESLHRAGIHPAARGSEVKPARLRALHGALQEVLREAIAANGSSIRDYRTAGGDAGAFQNAFRVYGRAGEPCLACGCTLEKQTIAGRTTTFCPACQRLT